EDWLIFTADMIKDQFLGYFISQLGALSFERFVAIHWWSWYERRGPSTIVILLVVELITNVPSWINVVLCQFDYIPHEMNMIFFAVILLFSILVSKKCNQNTVRTLQTLSGRSGNYSVSHAFQVKENLSVLKSILILMGSAVPIVSLCFIFFMVFFFAPEGWDRERFLCMELLDFSISLYAPTFIYASITTIKEYHIQLYSIPAVRKIADWNDWK
ncbi:hypothetical protein PENTCL1PPCAC_15796, partial [Pristionchus entomophagus]